MKSATRMDNAPIEVPRGLANVVVTETTLSDVRGQEGFYHYRQYSATDLARTRPVEDIWRLLLDGSLPTTEERESFAHHVASGAALSPELTDALPMIAKSTVHSDPLAGLRIALSLEGARAGMRPLYDLEVAGRRDDLIALASKATTIIAALHRLRTGQNVVGQLSIHAPGDSARATIRRSVVRLPRCRH
jgi:citrate synthase